MDEGMNVGLQDEIIAELEIELRNQPTFNLDIISIKVREAYRKVRARRCYENTSYTEEQIEKDLYDNHFQDIKDVAKYRFATIGGDFETSHSENGTSRTWRTEDEIMAGIFPFVKVL